LHTWGAIPSPPKSSERFIVVRARNDYAIALDAGGRLFGWGGALFDNPIHVATYLSGWLKNPAGYLYVDGPFTDIAAGSLQKDLGTAFQVPHFLAVDDRGQVHGWGPNRYGENAPSFPGLFTKVAAGYGFSLGIDYGGQLHHWGSHGVPLALGGGVYRVDKCPVGQFTSVSAGSHHATAVRGSAMSPTERELRDQQHKPAR